MKSSQPLAMQGRFLRAAIDSARARLARAGSAPVRKHHSRTIEQLEGLLKRVEIAIGANG